MSVFGQVWLWSLVAFVLGALLTWLLLVRPARARVRELERRVVAHRAEPAAAPVADSPPVAAVPADYGTEQPAYEPEPLPSEPGHDYAATELFEPADVDRTQYVAPADGRRRVDFSPEPASAADSDIETALNGAESGYAEPGYAEPGYVEPGYAEPGYAEPGYAEPGYVEPEPSRGLFQPALPSTPPRYELDDEQAEAHLDEDEPAAEALLPKRQRRESPLGGFDPPEPIQPSMRAVTRREPVEDVHSGSLFEPNMPEKADTRPGAVHGTAVQDTAEQEADGATVGPFGSGSAMPLPGGERPSEDFAVKASVTTLRYCPPESERFPDMVAEVWFRTTADAERVGFRPIS